MFENINLPTKPSFKSSTMKIKALDQRAGNKRGRTFKWHLDEEDREKDSNNLIKKKDSNRKHEEQIRLRYDFCHSEIRKPGVENTELKTIDIII